MSYIGSHIHFWYWDLIKCIYFKSCKGIDDRWDYNEQWLPIASSTKAMEMFCRVRVFQCDVASLWLIPTFRPVSLQQRFGSSLRQNKNIMDEFLTNNLVKHLVFLIVSCQAALWVNAQIIMFESIMCWTLLCISLWLPAHIIWLIWLMKKKIHSLDVYFSSFILLWSRKI